MAAAQNLAEANPATPAATLVHGAIARPDEPRHFMVIKRVDGIATAHAGDTLLARSEQALVVREVGRDVYEPVIYFPPADVQGELLEPTGETTRCPLKGTATTFNVVADRRMAAAAWSYQTTLDFDPRLGQLECCVAFDQHQVRIEVSSHDSNL